MLRRRDRGGLLGLVCWGLVLDCVLRIFFFLEKLLCLSVFGLLLPVEFDLLLLICSVYEILGIGVWFLCH